MCKIIITIHNINNSVYSGSGALLRSNVLQPDDSSASRLEDVRWHAQLGATEVRPWPHRSAPAEPDTGARPRRVGNHAQHSHLRVALHVQPQQPSKTNNTGPDILPFFNCCLLFCRFLSSVQATTNIWTQSTSAILPTRSALTALASWTQPYFRRDVTPQFSRAHSSKVDVLSTLFLGQLYFSILEKEVQGLFAVHVRRTHQIEAHQGHSFPHSIQIESHKHFCYFLFVPTVHQVKYDLKMMFFYRIGGTSRITTWRLTNAIRSIGLTSLTEAFASWV